MKSGNVENVNIGLSGHEFARHINGCRRNKRESQKKIYSAFYEHAIAICNSYAATPEDAIEIVNNGFLKIFRQIINYFPAYMKESSSFLSWLKKNMMEMAAEYCRKKYLVMPGSDENNFIATGKIA